VKVTKGDGDSLKISVVQSKIPTRCYYYPKCTKTDCPYTHPDTTCAYVQLLIVVLQTDESLIIYY
jgi:hypothetical protein